LLNQTKKKLLLIAIIVGFILVLVATFLFAEHLSRQNSPKEISNMLSEIKLTDQNGKAFNEQSLNQKPSLLFFGFTHCPEICPTTLSELSNIVDNLKNKINPTNIIFVTIDPQRDTQEYLKDYIQYFKGDVIAVTGDIKEIKKLADNWNVFFERVNTLDNDYTFNHTATVFMLDSNGVFRGTIAWGENPVSISQKIINLSKH
jgi:protein SCO1/2